MMNLDVHKSLDSDGWAGRGGLFSRLLLPGEVERVEPIHVDVHVREYADAMPLARPLPAAGAKTGELPVGTLLDCYL